MPWPVPFGSPAEMLIGCCEDLEFFMVREENLDVMERYHGLERPRRVQLRPCDAQESPFALFRLFPDFQVLVQFSE